MSRILFENKKVALGFAGAIIVGAALFSGLSGVASDTDDRSRLAEAQGFNGPAAKAASKTEEEAEKEEIEFAPDEELIDRTSGFDPTPGGSSDDEEEQDKDSGSRSDEDDEEEDEDDPYNPFADLEGPSRDEGF